MHSHPRIGQTSSHQTPSVAAETHAVLSSRKQSYRHDLAAEQGLHSGLSNFRGRRCSSILACGVCCRGSQAVSSLRKGWFRQDSAVGRVRHCGLSMAPSRSQPAPPPLSRKATAFSHRSSASQYSRAAFTSSLNVPSKSLHSKGSPRGVNPQLATSLYKPRPLPLFMIPTAPTLRASAILPHHLCV